MKNGRLVIRTAEMHTVALLVFAAVISLAGSLNVSVHSFQVVIWVFSLYTGFILSLMLLSKESRFLVRLLLYQTLPMLIIAVSCLTGKNTISVIIIAAATALFYYTGLRSGITPAYSILSKKIIYSGIISFAVLLILATHVEQLSELMTVLIILASAFGILTLVLTNQKTLDYNIYVKRGIDAGGIQQKLRMYNMNTVMVLVLAAVLLFNIRGIVIELYRLAALAAGYLIYFVLFLLTYLFPEGEGSAPPSENQTQLPFTDEKGGSSIVSVIFTVLISALFAVLIWKLAPAVLRALVSSLKSITGRLKAFFRSLFSINEAEKAKTLKKEYVDHVEFIREDKKTVRTIKKSPVSFRTLKSIEDPILKLRCFYKYFIYLMSVKLCIKNSDTTREILEKYKSLEGDSDDICTMTYEYEKARYGGLNPSDHALKKAEDLLQDLRRGINR